MYCSKCGNEIDSRGICPVCNKEAAAEKAEVNMQRDKKEGRFKKPQKIMAIVLAVLVFIGIGAYAAMEIFKSPFQRYLDLESKNLNTKINGFMQQLVKTKKEKKRYQEENYRSNVEFSFDVDSLNLPGTDENTNAIVKQILDGAKITADIKINPVKQKSVSDIGLFFKENKLIEGKLFKDGAKVGLSVPDLYSKSIILDGSDLSSFFENFGVTDSGDLPKKFLTNGELREVIKFEEKDIEAVITRYGKYFIDNLKEESVTLEEEVAYDTGIGTVHCDVFTVQLPQEELVHLMSGILDTLAEDQQLYDLTVQNYKNLMQLYKEIGYVDTTMLIDEEQLSMENYKKQVNELKQSLVDGMNNQNLPNGLNMKVFTKSGKILRRTIELDFGTENDLQKLTVDLQKWENGKEQRTSTKVAFESMNNGQLLNSTSITLQSNFTTGNEKGSGVGSKDFSFSFMGPDGQIQGLDFNTDTEITVNKSDNSTLKEVQFEMVPQVWDNPASNATIWGTLSTKSSYDAKQKADRKEYKLGLNIGTPDYHLISATLNMKKDDYFGVDFEMPEVNNSNSLVINQATPEDLEAVSAEVQEKLQGFLMKNIGVLLEFMPMLQ